MKLHPEERKARAEVALYTLRQRVKAAKARAIENEATRAKQLQTWPAAHADYLATWPVDWRECARKAAARRFAFGESEPRDYPAPERAQRYVENFDSAFRSWGYAREITRGVFMRPLDSEWYCDSDCNRTAKGIVVRLSHGRFVAGVRFEEGKHKDDGALIDFSEIHSGESNENDAAIMAARMAERVAEKEREYSDSWNAGAEFIGLREESQLTRHELLESLAEMRAARRLLKQSGVDQLPSVCNAMRAHVRAGLRTIRKARKRMAELQEQHANESGFQDGINC